MSSLAILPELPYEYNALEPVISGEIMELHHSKHHQVGSAVLVAPTSWFAEEKIGDPIARTLPLALGHHTTKRQGKGAQRQAARKMRP